MRTKSKTRKYIDPEGFYIARRRAGLTMMKAADLLDVDIRTIRNWENGSSKIPYAAFRIMRLAGGYALLGKEWEGWALWEGKLFTPAGRSFEPHELQYVGNYISMARLFIKSRENLKPDESSRDRANARTHDAPSKPFNATFERGRASGATAPFGAKRGHDAVVIAVNFSQQEKNKAHSLERRKSQSDFLFGRFGAYTKAANEAFYR